MWNISIFILKLWNNLELNNTILKLVLSDYFVPLMWILQILNYVCSSVFLLDNTDLDGNIEKYLQDIKLVKMS